MSERGADLVRATLAPLGSERTRVTLELEEGAGGILSTDAARAILDEVRGSFLDFLEDEGFRAAILRSSFAAAPAGPIAPRAQEESSVGPYPLLAAFALTVVMAVPMWQDARERAARKASVSQALHASHHERVSEGLRKLAASISDTRRGTPWSERARRLEEAATRIGAGGSPIADASRARAIFIDAAQWIGEGAALPVREELSAAAHAIDAQRPLSEQAAAIERYFDAAARAVSATGSGASVGAKRSVRVG